MWTSVRRRKPVNLDESILKAPSHLRKYKHEREEVMKTISKSSEAVLARFISSRLFKRVTFAILAAVLTTVFVLAAFSAPYDENVNANAGQKPSAADSKPVE